MLVNLFNRFSSFALSINLSFFFVQSLMYSQDIASQEVNIAVVAPHDIRQEWIWALRGGGLNIVPGSLTLNESEFNDLSLIVIDSTPISSKYSNSLYDWVFSGGILIYSGSGSALQSLTNVGSTKHGVIVKDPELLGVDYDGIDPGQLNYYPRVVRSTPLLSPFIANDGIRFGRNGVGHNYRFKPRHGSEVLARSSRLSLGNDGYILIKDNPTIITHRLGKGLVIFNAFSLGDISACYSSLGLTKKIDCSGAGTAHAMMRWSVANSLWELKGIQVPFPLESPGPGHHALIITGDVHNNPAETRSYASLQMAEIFEHNKVPLSLYVEGEIGRTAPDLIMKLKATQGVELSTHGLNGKIYMSKLYKLKSLGIYNDFRSSESLLGVPSFPQRKHLTSFRSHGWLSDEGAWKAFHLSGVGLVFDHVADSVDQSNPVRITPLWYEKPFKERLFVPVFEHNVSTAWADFKLSPLQSLNIANLASAEPEPTFRMPYEIYTNYVHDVHSVIHRLSSMGGLTEAWLWHPEGVLFNNGFGQVDKLIKVFSNEGNVSMFRGEEVATWRANRERFTVKAEWDNLGSIINLHLSVPRPELLPLPKESSPSCSLVSYWVIGSGHLPGKWQTSSWNDPYGRVITRYSHPANGYE